MTRGRSSPSFPATCPPSIVGTCWRACGTLGQGYREVLERPLIGPQALAGVADTLGLLRESLQSEPNTGVASERIGALLATLELLCADPPSHHSKIIHRLRSMAGPARELAELIRDTQARGPKPFPPSGFAAPPDGAGGATLSQSAYWSLQLERQIGCWLDVVDRYLPWIERLSGQPHEVVLGAWPRRAQSGDSKRLRWRPRCAPLRLGRGCPWRTPVRRALRRVTRRHRTASGWRRSPQPRRALSGKRALC